jgi:hypothetical protein
MTMKQIPKIKLVPVPETEETCAALGYEWNKEAGTRHFWEDCPTEVSLF